jgi:hypothetical protein
LNKPIDVNQLNEIKDLSFSYIESSFKQWKEIFDL